MTLPHAEVEQRARCWQKRKNRCCTLAVAWVWRRQFRLCGGLRCHKKPATCTLKRAGAARRSSVLSGHAGMHGTKAANFAVQECDLLIAVGARFDDRVTGKLNTFAPHASVIHMDTTRRNEKLRQAHVALQGDLNALLPALQQPLNINDGSNTARAA
ncbi:hypothetical protein ACLK1T_12055 [Escherichia coli]